METWMREYEKQLRMVVQQYPHEYVYSLEVVPEVCERMREAFRTSTYSKDSRAIKATCKVFGIRHTYKDINRFIANHK